MLLFCLCLPISCKDYTVDGVRFFDDMVTSGVSVQMQFHFATQTFHLVCITTIILYVYTPTDNVVVYHWSSVAGPGAVYWTEHGVLQEVYQFR